MSKRNDVHSPTNLITEDYDFKFAVDYGTEEFISDHVSWLRAEGHRLTAHSERGTHQCHHCGAHIRYVAILEHLPTGQHIAVGETCLENRFDRATKEFQAMRKQAALDRKEQRIRKAVAEFVEANPDLAWMGIRNAEARREAMPEASKTNGFLMDLGRKLNQYGELSERQVAAIRPSMERDVKFAEERAAKEAAKALEPDPEPVPTGKKVDIEGVVVGRKEHFTDFGCSMKLTVKLDNGSKVWFTEPSSVSTDKGDRIKCRLSSIEASDRDETFGFGKRPTRFEIVESAA